MWGEFETEAPALAALGKRVLHRKIAFLATLKEDGAPRLHPVRPCIGQGHLFVFIDQDSPKRRDLLQDGRYALHGAVNEANGLSPEIFITGSAAAADDTGKRTVAEGVWGEPVPDKYTLFEFFVDYLLITEYDETRQPFRRRWRAPQ